VQFPFMTRFAGSQQTPAASGQQALGDGCEQHLYKLTDGWAFIGCRQGDCDALARAIGAEAGTVNAIAAAAAKLNLTELRRHLTTVPGAAAMPVQTLAELRARHTIEAGEDQRVGMPAGSFCLQRGPHPCGYPTTLPLPTWIRPGNSPVSRLAPAPLPGSDTIAVLKETGYSDAEIAALREDGAVDTSWRAMHRYLPH